MGRLKNDCFALPPGVHWTPVEQALAHLKASLGPVAAMETVAPDRAVGRVLAHDVTALRDHPPHANSAVDGYGFAHGAASRLALMDAVAAAGTPFKGIVPKGSAIRILTGAEPPSGVDTVVLDEDVTLEEGQVSFGAGLKKGANIRAAGEDITARASLLQKGRQLTAGDIAMIASTGVADLMVFARLKVAVLSTGSEVVELGMPAQSHQIFDANRPMLKGLLAGWGLDVVDLGAVPDDRAAVLEALDRGAAEADVILTSGGASAGDEDHISASLKEAGSLETWRVAIKPGRPLAMGLWKGKPLFGLPGNPVAAFVCALVFAKPALDVLSGAHWRQPQGFLLEANFSKAKKPGREEYLRARRKEDRVDVFASEGSGRVSGLSWADGFVALEHDQGRVKPGELVRYIPFSDYGL